MTFEEFAAWVRAHPIGITEACREARLALFYKLGRGHEICDWRAFHNRLADAAFRAGLHARIYDSTDISIVDDAWRLAFEEAFGVPDAPREGT